MAEQQSSVEEGPPSAVPPSAVPPSAAPPAAVPPGPVDAFDRAKRHLVLACAAVAGGLAIAGSLDRTTGGVLVLIGWIAGIASLHRLGRTGSDQRARSRS